MEKQNENNNTGGQCNFISARVSNTLTLLLFHNMLSDERAMFQETDMLQVKGRGGDGPAIHLFGA